MIITNSHISMDASSGHKDVSMTAGGKLLQRNHGGKAAPRFHLDLPESGRAARPVPADRFAAARQSGVSQDGRNEADTTLHSESVVSRAVEALTGGRPQLRKFPPLQRFNTLFPNQLSEPPPPSKRFYRLGGQPFSLNFSWHRVHYEYEYLDFASSGKVLTADGRSINFSLDLSLSRTSVVRQSVVANLGSGYLVDPLVLHFDGGLETLGHHSFLFDLDADGERERIPGLASGSGFLALDLDGDKRITNGRELFGPTSGSGFADLAVHDLDENLWIDENDPIFSRLLIWKNPAQADQQLVSLKEAGVGAISLAHGPAPFNLKSLDNRLLGQVAASGIYLTEDGNIRSLHDINLALDDGESNSDRPDAPGSGAADRLAELQAVIGAQRRHLSALAHHYRHRFRRDREEQEERWRLLLPPDPDRLRDVG